VSFSPPPSQFSEFGGCWGWQKFFFVPPNFGPGLRHCTRCYLPPGTGDTSRLYPGQLKLVLDFSDPRGDVVPSPREWNRRSRRPRHTWLRTTKSDLAPTEHRSAYHRAQNRQAWSTMIGGNINQGPHFRKFLGRS